MLRVAFACLVLATIAYLMGATGQGGLTMEWGRVLMVAFLVPAVVGVSVGIIGGDRPDDVL